MTEYLKEPDSRAVGDFVQLVSGLTAHHLDDNSDNTALVAYALLMAAVAKSLGLPHSELHEVIDYVERKFVIEIEDYNGPSKRGN